jgi:hydroxyacid-oxoacid transhydrogenase
MTHDIAFEFAASPVRFGTREVGMDAVDLGATRALVVADPALVRLPPVQRVVDSLDANGVPWTIFDRVSIEPTDRSFLDAIGAAGQQAFDAIVAVGGGSTIDTAKAINLYTSYPRRTFVIT